MIRTQAFPLSRPVRFVIVSLICCGVTLLTGCSQSASGSCAAPQADIPATVHAGETLSFVLEGARWNDCYDTGQWPGMKPIEPAKSITVEAFTVGNTTAVVTTTTVGIARGSAQADVALPIPADIRGGLVIRLVEADYVLGTTIVDS